MDQLEEMLKTRTTLEVYEDTPLYTDEEYAELEEAFENY